jgi:hypothetical protein
MFTTPNITHIRMYKIRENHAILKDNRFSNSYSMENVTYLNFLYDYSYEPAFVFTNVVFNMYFIRDDSVITVERRVFTFVDAINQLGGLMGVVASVGLMISKNFQTKFYLQELMNSTL